MGGGRALVAGAALLAGGACATAPPDAPPVPSQGMAAAATTAPPVNPSRPGSPTAGTAGEASVPARDEPVDARATDMARYLAGMAGAGNAALDELRGQRFWPEHARQLDAHWERLDSERLAGVRQLSAAELTATERRSPWVFYPFGGADLAFADALFPHSPELLLVGLEPVGAIPEVAQPDPARQQATLARLREALVPALSLGYFITQRMEEASVAGRFPGAVSLLYVFLARTGHEILGVQTVVIDGQGAVQPVATRSDALAPGVAIRFRRPGEAPRQVSYFRVDLRDEPLGKDGRFLALVRRHGRGATVLKCASYLLHEARFSRLRQLILGQSDVVVQDPSGLPFVAFEPSRWSVALYGSFAQPVARFAHRPQPELRRACAARATVGKLAFPTGYQRSAALSSLLVARPRPEAKPTP